MGALVIVIAFFGAAICSVTAAGKSRNPVAWLVIGALLPVIGVIFIIVLPNQGKYSAEVIAPAEPQTQRAAQHLQTLTLDAVQRLGELKDRGLISSLEFNEKKAELLARL